MKNILHARRPVVKHPAKFGPSLAILTKHGDIGGTPPLPRADRL